MPDYTWLRPTSSDDPETLSEKKRIIDKIEALRNALRAHIAGAGPHTNGDALPDGPQRVRVATWNLREFDSASYGYRSREALAYIAEILSHFDLIALQEIRRDLGPLMSIRRLLGNSWAYIATDVTQGHKGNHERMVFLFNRQRVDFRRVAGELTLPDDKKVTDPFGDRFRVAGGADLELPPGQVLASPAGLPTEVLASGQTKIETDVELPLPEGTRLVLPPGTAVRFAKNARVPITADNAIAIDATGTPRLPEAAEIVLPPDSLIGGPQQFARTPFVAAFQAGWLKINLATVHIYYGSGDAGIQQRTEEIRRLTEMLAERAADDADSDAGGHFIILGDFNIVGPGHVTMDALTSNGFVIPGPLQAIPGSNVRQDKYYDQIALWTGTGGRRRPYSRVSARRAGVFDYFDIVYRSDEEAIYRPQMQKPDGDGFYKSYSTWRTYQMSDHLPMWVELDTDFADDYRRRWPRPSTRASGIRFSVSENDRLYRKLFQYAPIGILRTTMGGRVLDANPTVARMLGYGSVTEAMAAITSIADVLYVNPVHRQQLLQMTVTQDQLIDFESQFFRKDRSVMDCRIHVRIERRPDGSVDYLEGFVEDISQQKKISRALAESEARYRSVFENTGSATIIIEPDMTISLANSGFETMTGYAKAEIEGRMKWSAIIAYPDDLERMMAYHLRRRESDDRVPIEYEFMLVDRHGEKKSVFARVDMIDGTARSVASIIDLSSLKAARRSLRESESQRVGIVEAFDGLIYIVSADYRITFMNRALKQAIGERADRNCCYQAIYAFDRPCPWCRKERVFAGKTVKYEFRRPCDQRWCYAVTAPVFDIDDAVTAQQTVIIDIHERKQAELSTRAKGARLQKENLRLRTALRGSRRFGGIVGRSMVMRQVYEMILRAAATDANVIIYGESGTGKELVARAIHDMSDRSAGRFVPVNCGAIPRNLMESEFFGHKKGSFTGADRDKPGVLDHATGGTLFLDELGEISEAVQVKLLRVIEGGGYTPIGALDPITADVRIVAATNRNLPELVGQGRIREDFFYRIHIIPIYLPPLSERTEDIPLLVEHFLEKYDAGRSVRLRTAELDRLVDYDWPGNVRELENTIQRYVSLNALAFTDGRDGAGESSGAPVGCIRRVGGGGPESGPAVFRASSHHRYSGTLRLESYAYRGGAGPGAQDAVSQDETAGYRCAKR